MKIVAVCASQVAGGNVETLMDHALTEYSNRPAVDTVRFDLSGLEVGPCRHCNFCLKKQLSERFCSLDDDMSMIYPELIEASGLIIATPVHFGRLSGTCADFIDRLRVFVHGNITRGALRNKVGAAIAVAWFRSAGTELTLISVNAAFHALGMVIASPDLGLFGGSAFSSIDGTGSKPKEETLLVTEDKLGMASARSAAYRVFELSGLLEAGKDAGGG